MRVMWTDENMALNQRFEIHQRERVRCGEEDLESCQYLLMIRASSGLSLTSRLNMVPHLICDLKGPKFDNSSGGSGCSHDVSH